MTAPATSQRFAARVGRIRPSGIRAVLNEADRLAAAGEKVINFAIGRPDFDTPTHVKMAAAAALDAGQVHYTPNAGIPRLRRAIAAKLARENGLQVEAEGGIMVTAGACEAVCVIALGLLDPGEEMVVVTPAWTTYAAAAELAGGRAVEVPARIEDGFLPDPAAIRRAISPRTRLLVLNSPNNPTGAVYPEALLRDIAAIAEAADLIVLSDEIYERILFGPTPHVAFATLPGMAGRTLTVNGLAKAYSMTGWRVGYIAGPPDLIGPLMRIHQNLVASACSFAQAGAAEALEASQDCVEEMRTAYQARRDALCAAIEGVPGLRLARPQGTFYSFPAVPGDGAELALRLLREARIAAVPGGVFGAGFERHLRMSYCAALEDIADGARRAADVLSRAARAG